MIADASAEIPAAFYGYYLFFVEMTAGDALKGRPTFVTVPPGSNPEVYGRYFAELQALLELAVRNVDLAEPMVPQRCRLVFEAEASSIRWFYRTARTEANFVQSCRYREELLALAEKDALSQQEQQRAGELYQAWLAVLQDEQENTQAALRLAQADCRLDFYFRGDHSFPHLTEMLEAKLGLLDTEINEFLPALAEKCQAEPN